MKAEKEEGLLSQNWGCNLRVPVYSLPGEARFGGGCVRGCLSLLRLIIKVSLSIWMLQDEVVAGSYGSLNMGMVFSFALTRGWVENMASLWLPASWRRSVL